MGRKVVVVLVSLAMLLYTFVIVDCIMDFTMTVGGSETLYVNETGTGGAYPNIQDAIDAANDGDTIFAYSGTYYENVIVNKTINLIGEDWETTVIDGGDWEDVVKITADWVNVTGFTLTGGGLGSMGPGTSDSGLELWEVENCCIINNKISDNPYYGIHIYKSSNNDIIGNNVSNNEYGFWITDSSNNNITHNYLSMNDGYSIGLGSSSNNIITTNDILINSGGIYLVSASNNKIIANNIHSNDGEGIYLSNSANNNIFNGNNISNNWNGFLIISSSGNNITCNLIHSNIFRGVFIWSSSNNNITGNNVFSNNNDGIILWDSSNDNVITNNYVSNNENGIFLYSSLNNSIYHNNIINNTNQAFDDTNNGNRWDNGYPSGGNYWSDLDEPSEGAYDEYQGVDQNMTGGDGIVDNGTIAGGGKNPYVIDSDSQDNYPLIEPYYFMILKQGWNLISIPLIQEEQNLIKVLTSIDGLYDAVQWNDITDTEDAWKHYKIGKPFGNDLSQINETMGFWIHITQPGDTIFLYNGTEPTVNQTITLHPGWNLVGYPSLMGYNRTGGLNNLTFDTHIDAIWTYNAATQKWKELGPLDYFELGMGYWIHAITECEWEVPL